MDGAPEFERVAPVRRATVWFRLALPGRRSAEADALHERFLHAVNDAGGPALSATKLRGKVALRLSVGEACATEADLARMWSLLLECAWRVVPPGPYSMPDPARRPSQRW